MSQKLAWGIIGTGTIAHTFARELRQFQMGDLLAVGSRTQRAADSFGEALQVPHRYGSYEQALTDKDVQAVYIAVPHSLHEAAFSYYPRSIPTSGTWSRDSPEVRSSTWADTALLWRVSSLAPLAASILPSRSG